MDDVLDDFIVSLLCGIGWFDETSGVAGVSIIMGAGVSIPDGAGSVV